MKRVLVWLLIWFVAVIVVRLLIEWAGIGPVVASIFAVELADRATGRVVLK